MRRGTLLVLSLVAVLACQNAPAAGRAVTMPTVQEHDPFFPIASGPHAVTCNDCHGTSDSFKGFECTTCHTAPATTPNHAGVTGYQFQSASCYQCHPRGTAGGIASHPWFPIAQTDVHNSGVAKCADCHADSSTFSGAPAANVERIACSACHNDNAASVANQRGVTLTAAHGAARVGRDIWNTPQGMQYAPPPSFAANPLAQCLNCHAGNIGGDVAAVSTPLVFRLAQHDAHCRMSDKGVASGDRTHNVDHVTDITGVNTCNACHNQNVGTGDTPWARDWTHASPVDSCIACHEHAGGGAPVITCR